MNEKKYYITPESKESNLTVLERIKKVGGKAVAVIFAAGALTGFAYLNGDNKSPEKYEKYINKDIKSITIEDINVRKDPNIKNEEDNNIIERVNEPVKIDVSGDKFFYVYGEDGIEGTWYGFNKENLEKADSKLNNNNDKDGIEWVNEKGVIGIERSGDNSATK